MHPSGHSGNGCSMPGQVRHGKDSSVCAGHTATAGAGYWAGTVGETTGEGILVGMFRQGALAT